MSATAYEESIESVLDYYDVTATTGYVEESVPGGRVHYLEAGSPDGQPVVLLHGGASQATEWIPLFSALSEYRLLALERPRYGLSAPYDHRGENLRAFSERLLSGFLDGVGVERPHLVGNSFGGFHALAFALLRPDAVDHLVPIGAPAGISQGFPWLLRLLGVRGLNRLVYPQTIPGDVAEARDVYRRINVVDDGALPDTYLESVVAAADTPGRRETMLSLFESVVGLRGPSADLYLGDELSAIDAPTRFVWGEEDWYYPPSVGRPIAEGMGDAEFVELADANHKPWFEPASTVGAQLAGFLPESRS
jgi:pimeloyl-ACP methyl ester carboxylesterase